MFFTYWADLNPGQIAELMDTSLRTVERDLSAAKKKLGVGTGPSEWCHVVPLSSSLSVGQSGWCCPVPPYVGEFLGWNVGWPTSDFRR